MIFRQLLESESCTYTYIVADPKTKQALIIDPVWETLERDQQLIKELELDLKYSLETHIHADHITSANSLKELFPEIQRVVPAIAGADYGDKKINDGDKIKLGELEILVISTPGHTNGCTSYYIGDRVFTGDALLIRGCGRTDFQEGSVEILFSSVREKLFTLPDETLVFPGHDYKGRSNSSIGEEKKWNPRLKMENSIEEFKDIMNNLNLSQPKKIKQAVPANLVGGQSK